MCSGKRGPPGWPQARWPQLVSHAWTGAASRPPTGLGAWPGPVCGLDPRAAGSRGGPVWRLFPLAQSPGNMVGAASQGFWRSS